MRRMAYTADLTVASDEAVPLVRPAAVVVPDPSVAGAWTVAGDLDNDGSVELVQARLREQGDVHSVASVAAFRLDGTELWRWGHPDEGVAALHSDAPCQIHDWNRDGRMEVVIVTNSHVTVLDGATGKELWRFPVPDPEAGDCLAFANLTGGPADDILIKTRYDRIWAFTWRGRKLWDVERPAGMKTAHQPLPLDLDGDGFDEIVAGYAVLDQDGRLLWALDRAACRLGRGHLDCCRVWRSGERPADWRLLFSCCGDEALLCLDGTGRIVWDRRGLHFESIRVGHFLPRDTSKQILVDIDHAPAGRSPLRLYDGNGECFGEINSVYGRQHPLIRWDDPATDRIVACEDRLLVSGETGRPLARFDTPVPDGTRFEQMERPAEHRERGEFHLLGHTGNLLGAGRQDLALCTNPGGIVWIYRNSLASAEPVPPGFGGNVTLY